MEENNLQCPHCGGGFGLKHILSETKTFLIVCDVHPLVEGHILAVPKAHVTCMGALDSGLFSEYERIYQKIFSFLRKAYGSAAAFEHGIAGQTVSHAHAHFLPFKGSVKEIVPEKEALWKINTLHDVKKEFGKTGKYLFVALNENMWLADNVLGVPGFFRERFAKALDAGERGNWESARSDQKLMKEFEKDIRNLKSKWRR